MKITVLTYLEKEGAEVSDVAVEQVAEALRQGGHKVSLLGIHGDVRKLTQKSFSSPSRSFGSGIFDHGKGRDEGHGHGHGNHGD